MSIQSAIDLLKQVDTNVDLRLEMYACKTPADTQSCLNKNGFLFNINELEDKNFKDKVWKTKNIGVSVIFITLFDGTANFQALLKKDVLGDSLFDFFNEVIDIGDFVEVQGIFFITKRGEKTVEVKDWHILSKSLLPLPEKWHGLQDPEERFRKRYLDILMNPEVMDLVKKKSKFWDATRNFLKEKGFLEVETPVLEATTGGADAKPFATHHNALDVDVFLRISMGELWQKKLMVAGIPKTFEIGRQFRNEGMDAEHLQDYTQMEFYWAYANYEDGMKLTEEMYKYIAQETFGTLQFNIRGFEVDLSQPWEKYDYVETIKKYTDINVLEVTEEEIRNKLDELGVKYDLEGFNITRAIDSLWKFCRRKIGGPGFLINVPVLKTHFQCKVSLGLKNLKGCLQMSSRRAFHQKDLHTMIALLNKSVIPKLTIIDGIYAMEYGPGTMGTAHRMNLIIAGRDSLSCDIVGSAILGIDSASVEHLQDYARLHNRKLDISTVEIKGEKIGDVAKKLGWKFSYENVFRRASIKGI